MFQRKPGSAQVAGVSRAVAGPARVFRFARSVVDYHGEPMSLVSQLFEEILQARQRVYAAGDPTPLQRIALSEVPGEIWVKREDLGPIKAYKWRGAYNAMAALSAEELARGVVCSSAGNHAQGVARAARTLGAKARIYMPRSTPQMKQRAVETHGGDAIEVILHGDAYDDAAAAAKEDCVRSGAVFVHPYDALTTMGGQGTLADEVVMSGHGPFSRVYLQIGGGGMAAAVACWLKRYFPQIRVVGVEGVDQASMKAALEAGEPVTLDYVDVFCDGTAVRRAGDLTFTLCRELLDEIVTVTNDEVSHAVRVLWDELRAIPEPAGAMGLAALLQDAEAHKVTAKDRSLVILCGANMDFSQLASIAQRGGFSRREAVSWRIGIPEHKGELQALLRSLPTGVNVAQLLYGKTGEDRGWPVITFEASEAEQAQIAAWLARHELPWSDVTGHADVLYRVIHYRAETFRHPLFANLEFPERPGAFSGFMARVADLANLCYFNYSYSGERVGRALVGMEFDHEQDRATMERRLYEELVGHELRAAHPVPVESLERILG